MCLKSRGGSGSVPWRDRWRGLAPRLMLFTRVLRKGLPACFLISSIAVPGVAQTQRSYYEFGTVVAIGSNSIDLQNFDPQLQRMVQHSFALSSRTRADVVHVGDPVEVLFTAGSGEWLLERLIVLAAGFPLSGLPPAPASREASRGAAATARQPAVARDKRASPAAVSSGSAAHAAPSSPAAQPALLGSAAAPKSTSVVPVALGSPAEAKARANAGKTNAVAIDHPAEECNRSSADWPAQPLRIAVLDFRYPTEHEEAHDNGISGGGSGTAVADLVFARLEDDEQSDDRFLVSRADRRRLDRSDFAGAARLGRQLGVDAVLAGTFVPVAEPADAEGFAVVPKTFELRAGIVDTCTGQLLLQTSSVVCAGAVSPGITAGADPKSCTRYAITASESANPKAYLQDFKAPLDALLYPLEHQGASGQGGGVVTRVSQDKVTVQLPTHSGVRAGDQLVLYASRLAKNPTTYTLQNLQHGEIGRMSIQTIQGDLASGSYTGDFTPHAGDRAEPAKE